MEELTEFEEKVSSLCTDIAHTIKWELNTTKSRHYDEIALQLFLDVRGHLYSMENDNLSPDLLIPILEYIKQTPEGPWGGNYALGRIWFTTKLETLCDLFIYKRKVEGIARKIAAATLPDII